MANNRLTDVQKANLYLFDLLFRHQVYLEGIKGGFALYFRRMMTQLYGEFAKYVGMTRYDTLDQFSRAELQRFIYMFQQAQTKAYNQYTQQLIVLLKQFVGADVDVMHSLFVAATGAQSDQASRKTSVETLWQEAFGAINPANGLTISEALKQFGQTLATRIAARINIGYANGEKPRDLFAAIVGTNESTFRDGMFATFAAQNVALLSTAIQHLSARTQTSVTPAVFAIEQWVSVLDSHTTLICRSRNGRTWKVGDGPYPPAHYNCRSKRVPVWNGEVLHDIPSSFRDWAVTQPEAFLRDALGVTLAAKLLSNSLDAKDISINDVSKPLTVSEFRDKISLITL